MAGTITLIGEEFEKITEIELKIVYHLPLNVALPVERTRGKVG